MRPGGLWLENENGNLQLHLTAQADAQRQGNRAHLAFLVADLAALRARLAGSGILIREAYGPIPGYERCECRDPFGNRLEFMQELAPPG